MKRIATLAISIVLVSCSTQNVGWNDAPDDLVAKQCTYEATMATQSGDNPFMLGYRRQELFVMCMRAKGR